MVRESLPNNLNTYANLIATYDNNMRYLPTSASAPYHHRTTTTSRRDPDAMEIDSSYAPAGSKEREDRQRKGLCFKCGKHGHISQDCSVPLPQTRANYEPNLSRPVSSPVRNRRGSDSSTNSRSPSQRSQRSRSNNRRNSRKGSSQG